MNDDEHRGPGRPPGSSEPTAPVQRPAGAAPDIAASQGSAVARRSAVAALSALLLFGSCGIAFGLYRGTGGDGTVVVIPSPGPSAAGSPSPSASTTASPSVAPGVDLVIAELSGSQVVVANVGTADAGRFVVSVGEHAFIVEDGLAAGGSAAFSYPCRAGPLTAVADSTGRVEESDETNNVLSAGPFDCTSPGPSASPGASPSASPSTSPSAEPRQPDLIVSTVASNRVVVKNVGDGAAGGFVVDADEAGTFQVAGLSPGASRTIGFPCAEGPLAVTVDSTGKVSESNEANNTKTGGPFDCLPDLVVSAIGIDSVTIANQGEGDAGPSSLSVNGQIVDVPAIGAGQSIVVHTGCIGGTVSAKADALDQVTESDEGNNGRTEDVGPCP